MEFSKKWSEQTKSLINNSKINLISVYDNTDYITDELQSLLDYRKSQVSHHCDFCGQRVKYVSLLDFTKQGKTTSFQIGKECLIYMDNHNLRVDGYKEVTRNVARIIKDLIEKNKIKSRKAKYAKEYATEIKWLQDNHSHVSKSRFLIDMLDILTTGKKVFSENMNFYLKSTVEKLKTTISKSLPDDGFTKMKSRLERLLHLISIHHNIKITDDFGVISDMDSNVMVNSDYTFTLSVYRYFLKNGNLSQKQLFYMNSLYKKYSELITSASKPQTALMPF